MKNRYFKVSKKVFEPLPRKFCLVVKKYTRSLFECIGKLIRILTKFCSLLLTKNKNTKRRLKKIVFKSLKPKACHAGIKLTNHQVDYKTTFLIFNPLIQKTVVDIKNWLPPPPPLLFPKSLILICKFNLKNHRSSKFNI